MNELKAPNELIKIQNRNVQIWWISGAKDKLISFKGKKMQRNKVRYVHSTLPANTLKSQFVWTKLLQVTIYLHPDIFVHLLWITTIKTSLYPYTIFGAGIEQVVGLRTYVLCWHTSGAMEQEEIEKNKDKERTGEKGIDYCKNENEKESERWTEAAEQRKINRCDL